MLHRDKMSRFHSYFFIFIHIIGIKATIPHPELVMSNYDLDDMISSNSWVFTSLQPILGGSQVSQAYQAKTYFPLIPGSVITARGVV